MQGRLRLIPSAAKRTRGQGSRLASSSSSAASSFGLPSTVPDAEPIEVKLPGLTLRGFTVGPKNTHRKCLAAHGWVDNSATHSFTYKPWVDAGFQFVSIDVVGHGRSDKRGLQDQYGAGGYALALMEAARGLGWAETTAFALCSHSMSAGVSSMTAGAFRDRISMLALLEGIGMNTKAESQSGTGLLSAYEGRKSLLERLAAMKKSGRAAAGKVYSSVEEAAKARVQTVARYPGRQSIELEAARLLVTRGTVRLEGEGESSGSGSGFVFSHDPRLMEPSAAYISEAQMLDYLRRITAPTLCVTGSSGWPWPQGLMLGRIAAVPSMEHVHLAGGHHLHLDPSTAPTVQAVLADFLKRKSDLIDARIEEAERKAKAAAAEAAAKKASGSKGSLGAASAAIKGSLNPTAPEPGTEKAPHLKQARGQQGGADEDAIKAAQDIATSAAAAEEDRPDGGNNSSKKTATGSSRTEDKPLWTPRHIFIAHSEPFPAFSAPPAATTASGSAAASALLSHAVVPKRAAASGEVHCHVHERVLVIDRVAAPTNDGGNNDGDAVSAPFSLTTPTPEKDEKARFVYPRYGWATGEHEDESGQHHSHHHHVQEKHSDGLNGEKLAQHLSQLVWCELPDHVAGLPFVSHVKRNAFASASGNGGAPDASHHHQHHHPHHRHLKSLRFGAFVPRIFLASMPTLEAVTIYASAASSSASGSGAGAGSGGSDAALKGLKELEAKGSSY